MRCFSDGFLYNEQEVVTAFISGNRKNTIVIVVTGGLRERLPQGLVSLNGPMSRSGGFVKTMCTID